ncbi:MAG: hypothetical protein DRZ80_06455 [Thermoprotei archaeon]|nr:MAG: hypothetical protein DRZ80_06455 [Thermoprotei archaeon]
MKGQSTILAQILLLAMAIILATTFTASLNAHVSYYMKRRELASVFIFTLDKGGWVNFTSIHSGGDTVDVFGEINLIFKNGTSKPLTALLIRGEARRSIHGRFQLNSFKFGEKFKVCVNSTGLNDCTVHLLLSCRSHVLAEVYKKI